MARVTIYHARLYEQTTAIARRRMRTLLNELEGGAKAIAAMGQYSTGRLAESIHQEGPNTVGTRVTGSVGTRLRYATAVERGARVHSIFPQRAPHVYRFGRTRAPTLKFYWRRAGRVAYFNQIPGGPGTIGVSHPGQKGKHFLLRPMRDLALRYRMRIVVFEV